MFKKVLFLLVVCMFVCSFFSLGMASGIVVLAPNNGESVSTNDVVIIGKAGKSANEVDIKGISGGEVKVKVKKGGFFAKVKLNDGDNKLTLSSDDGSNLELNIKVGNSKVFNYHPSESDVEDCSMCHSDVDGKGYALKPAAPLCYECHDAKNDKAYVHGPINMGVCNVCHLPHGSSNEKFLMVNNKVICSGCHEELMPKHPITSNKFCIECHDPHSSDKEFHIK